jgi:hypothetical protein
MPTSTNKSEESWKTRAEVRDIHLGAHPGFLHWAVRHALLGGGALRALLGNDTPWVRHLGCFSTSASRLYSGNTPPHSLGGCPSGLHNGWVRTMAPACDKGSMDIRGPAALDKQRL